MSCLVVEVPGTGRLLIDPGFPAGDGHELDEQLPVDAVLVSPQHPDHLDRDWAGQLLDRGLSMIDGAPGPPNLGFLLDVRLLHPGDGAELHALPADPALFAGIRALAPGESTTF